MCVRGQSLLLLGKEVEDIWEGVQGFTHSEQRGMKIKEHCKKADEVSWTKIFT